MKKIPMLIIAAFAALLHTGCSTTSKVGQFAGDALATAAGAAAGYELSDKNPGWALAGGVAALGVKRAYDSAADQARAKELKDTYDMAYSQAIKEQYWHIQNLQAQNVAKKTDAGGDYVELPITAPQRLVNGVVVDATVEYVRIKKTE